MEELLRELVQKSLGELERAILATPDGIAMAVSNSSDFDDVVAALGAAVVAGVSDAFRQYFLTNVEYVAIELDDGRMMIAKNLGYAVLCLLTRPRPNLGLVYHLLDRYSAKLLSTIGQGYEAAAEPALVASMEEEGAKARRRELSSSGLAR